MDSFLSMTQPNIRKSILMLKPPKPSQNLEGKYTNYFEVGFNAYEFVFNFGQLYSGNKIPAFSNKMITSPAYAKIFFDVLKESIEHYEAKYGCVQ